MRRNAVMANFAIACAFVCVPLFAPVATHAQQPANSAADIAPAGTVPWQLLQQAKTIQKPDKKYGPVFNAQIKELNSQSVKLYGFMMPLDQSDKQSRFLLSPFPPHCAFCMPGGPESLVEIVASTPVKFTWEPIVVSGKMHVLDNDIVYYRLTDAQSVKF